MMARKTVHPDVLSDGQRAQSIPKEKHGYLLSYVNDNCCNSALCLTAVSDHMGASIYAVSRTFKDLTGKGFREYVTEKRLENACILLQTTDWSISRIATMSGFENATYFTTVFKREYNLPPSKFRAQTRQ